MESSSGFRQPLAAEWETRQYLVPKHLLLERYISSIGIMCHPLSGSGSVRCPATVTAHLGATTVLPFDRAVADPSEAEAVAETTDLHAGRVIISHARS
jgi:hypothetical protein